MDILDTFGDWIQMIVAIVGFFIGAGFLSGLIKNIILPIILGVIMWSAVYDYDLVIGFLIGGGLSSLAALLALGKNNGPRLDLAFSVQFWTGLTTAAIMIAKMVLFW